MKNFTEFELPKTAYAAFDAVTLKSFIIDRLNENEVFRDQVYEGSNLNAFIDIVAYMYHVLLFYLNTTSSESTFTTATLYENMNKIVSNLGYKPTGKQTSSTTVSISALAGIPADTYTVKRFSTITVNGIPYVNLKDISFEKTTSLGEAVSIDNNVLHQGEVREYASYTGAGESFETIRVINTSTIDNSAEYIADNTFTVFVKSTRDETWREWSETNSLFLEDGVALKYEKRLNEKGHFEFKFGNNITGKSLEAGDIVQIYYLNSKGSQGIIAFKAINNQPFVLYNTPRFTEISNNIYSNNPDIVIPSELPFVRVTNTNRSSPISEAETVEEMRNNYPKIFSSQNRLVTKEDYESFINKSFNNIVKTVKVLDNDTYTSKFIKYYYDIGLNKPNDDARVLMNQVAFTNSTSFNNVYIFTVPKMSTILNETIPNYLNLSQKQLIINESNLKKDITHNIVCVDPIYKAFNIGINVGGEEACLPLKDSTVLVIKKLSNSKISTDNIKDRVVSIIKDYFSNIQLGQLIDITSINNEILNLEGVRKIYTRRTDIGYEVPKLNMVVWNPIYEDEDILFTSQNFDLEDYQYGYFYEISKLKTKIIVENE